MRKVKIYFYCVDCELLEERIAEVPKEQVKRFNNKTFFTECDNCLSKMSTNDHMSYWETTESELQLVIEKGCEDTPPVDDMLPHPCTPKVVEMCTRESCDGCPIMDNYIRENLS